MADDPQKVALRGRIVGLGKKVWFYEKFLVKLGFHRELC